MFHISFLFLLSQILSIISCTYSNSEYTTVTYNRSFNDALETQIKSSTMGFKLNAVSKVAFPTAGTNAANDVSTLATSSKAGTLKAEITLGTPPQTFDVLLDTGSSILWVVSTSCSTKLCNSFTNRFDQSKSSSFVKSSDSGVVAYADRTEVRYDQAKETLIMGQISISGQEFSLANSVAAPRDTLSVDGVMGLGPPGNPARSDVFGALSRVPSVGQTIASFWFNLTDSYPIKDTLGEITLGYVSSRRFKGEFLSLPITEKRDKWTTSLEAITKSNGQVLSMFSDFVYAGLDTGTTYIYLPDSTARSINAYFKTIEKPDNSFILPCSEINKLDSISFFMGGSEVPMTVPISQLFIPVLAASSYFDASNTVCHSVIRKNSEVGGLNLIGALFLQNFYTVYDYDTATVNFALTNQEGNAPVTGGSFLGPKRPPINLTSAASTQAEQQRGIIIYVVVGVVVFLILAAVCYFYLRASGRKKIADRFSKAGLQDSLRPLESDQKKLEPKSPPIVALPEQALKNQKPFNSNTTKSPPFQLQQAQFQQPPPNQLAFYNQPPPPQFQQPALKNQPQFHIRPPPPHQPKLSNHSQQQLNPPEIRVDAPPSNKASDNPKIRVDAPPSPDNPKIDGSNLGRSRSPDGRSIKHPSGGNIKRARTPELYKSSSKSSSNSALIPRSRTPDLKSSGSENASGDNPRLSPR